MHDSPVTVKRNSTQPGCAHTTSPNPPKILSLRAAISILLAHLLLPKHFYALDEWMKT